MIARHTTDFACRPSVDNLIIEISSKQTIRSAVFFLLFLCCYLKTVVRPLAENASSAHAVKAVIEWGQEEGTLCGIVAILYDVALNSRRRHSYYRTDSSLIVRGRNNIEVLFDNF